MRKGAGETLRLFVETPKSPPGHTLAQGGNGYASILSFVPVCDLRAAGGTAAAKRRGFL